MSYIEILTANGLTVEQWEDGLFKEYIGMLQCKKFMGTGSDSIIQVKEDLVKKAGDAITIGLRGRVQGGLVTGNAKAIGNEGTLSFYNQRITIDNVRRAIKFEDIPMSQKRVMFNVLTEGKAALEDEFSVDFDNDVINALIDHASGRVRGRYLYGAADSNWNATHATALQNIDATNDMLSTLMIGIAKRKALIPVNATAKIRPARFKTGKDFEQWFTLWAHTYALRDMVNSDAAWRNRELNLTPAGTGSVLFSGSAFKGAWEGVLVYENERLPLISSTIQCTENLLLGAQAAAVVWGQRTKFNEEEADFGHDVSYELHEIRGIEKLVFNRETEEDNAVVHVFSAAVAD
jgi:N4-gp56 family major capsid protein